MGIRFFSIKDDFVLNERFYFLGILLNRFLNLRSRRYELISIDFYFYGNTEECIIDSSKDFKFYYSHNRLICECKIENDFFLSLDYFDQKFYLWNMIHKMLQVVSLRTKNNILFNSSTFAYKEGLKINLIPEFMIITQKVILHKIVYFSTLLVHLIKYKMQLAIVLEKDDNLVFKKILSETIDGDRSFYTPYKRIDQINNAIIIKANKNKILFEVRLSEDLKEIT